MAISKQGKYGTNPVVVMANTMLSVTVRYVVVVKAGGSSLRHALPLQNSSLVTPNFLNIFLVVMGEIISSCTFICFSFIKLVG